jgi:hypothetical protein
MDIVIKKLTKMLSVLVCAVLIVDLTGCGTLMYPERRGQRGGRLDAGVAVLDGIGLLFFIIPGVIAYAVDFSNGTIYLPGGVHMSSLDLKNIKQVKFDPKHTTMAGIERIIMEQTGYEVAFGQANMRVVKLTSTNDMMVKFAQFVPGVRVDRLSLNR